MRSGLYRVLANIAFITGANLFGRLLNLVLHAALGRFFGPEGLGGYATAIAIAGYFMFMADFGMSPRIVREGAITPEQLDEEYANALGFKIAMGAVSLAILILVVRLLPYEDSVIELVFLLGLASIVRSFSYLNESVCRARERLDLEGAIGLLNAALFVGGTLILFYLGYSVRAVGWVSLGAASVQLVVSVLCARRFVSIRVKLPPWLRLGRAALPYATTSLSLLAFAQVDVLIVSMIESQEFVGHYASVSRLLLIAGTFGALAGAGVLPTASRLYGRSDSARFDALVNEALRFALLVGGMAALGLAFISRPVMGLIYGEQFADLYPLLRAGSIYVLFKFSVSVLAMVLTSIGRQGSRARATLIGFASTVVLVLALTPYWGLAGTVGAMVGSEFIFMSCLCWFLSARIRWPSILRTVFALLVCGAIATWAHLALLKENGWLNLCIATIVPLLVYLGLLFISGEGRRAWRFARALHRGGSVID